MSKRERSVVEWVTVWGDLLLNVPNPLTVLADYSDQQLNEVGGDGLGLLQVLIDQGATADTMYQLIQRGLDVDVSIASTSALEYSFKEQQYEIFFEIAAWIQWKFKTHSGLKGAYFLDYIDGLLGPAVDAGYLDDDALDELYHAFVQRVQLYNHSPPTKPRPSVKPVKPASLLHGFSVEKFSEMMDATTKPPPPPQETADFHGLDVPVAGDLPPSHQEMENKGATMDDLCQSRLTGVHVYSMSALLIVVDSYEEVYGYIVRSALESHFDKMVNILPDLRVEGGCVEMTNDVVVTN